MELQLYSKDLKFNNWYLFFIFTGIYVVLAYYTNHFILKDQLYYNSLGDRLALDRIDAAINKRRDDEWIGYIAAPLILLLKTGYTAVCISLGGFIAGIETPFKKVFKVALFAELVLLIGSVAQSASLYLFKEINTLEDLQQFAPFSLYAIFGSSDTPAYLNYPLRVINLFEVAYWIILAMGLKALLQRPFNKMLQLVLGSYGLGLLVWVAFIVFLTINTTS